MSSLSCTFIMAEFWGIWGYQFLIGTDWFKKMINGLLEMWEHDVDVLTPSGLLIYAKLCLKNGKYSYVKQTILRYIMNFHC